MDKLTAEIIVKDAGGRIVGGTFATDTETIETETGAVLHEFVIHFIIKEKGGKYALFAIFIWLSE